MSKDKLSFDDISTKQILGLIVLAYAFSFLIRMIWVWQFKDTSSFYWNDQLMINTNDGYFFASGVQKVIEGLHQSNPRVFGLFDYGVIFLTSLLVKFTHMSIETAILYMPTIISSLVVIPIILISRLYNKTLWGFFAALLGSITWSYYNRTMTGYYDTDMFSAMAPMFILFFLMKSTIDLNIKTVLYGALTIIIYPFLYDQGQAIVYAMGIIYAIYMVLFHRNDKITYISIILIFIALMPLPISGLVQPYSYLVHILLVIGAYFFLSRRDIDLKALVITSSIVFFLFLLLGDVFTLIFGKIISYTVKGTEAEGSLHFYAVNQTVREAGQIPFETFANRTSGSVLGVIIALVGYILLVIRHRTFIMALPLIGIGVFALWGGLRFTVYAVPIAGMSAVYLFYFIADRFINDKKARIAFVAILTAGMIYPNITHIIGYKVPTVL
ncbi:MAG TPA: peptide-binding protein, partial [Campylobacterales bacterium]|nr:peptide-binding protein [Campylobacterales bacterium]